ncbi:MAG TPA: hypothetical protein VGB97_04215 [Candidatus Paceibacterota bacterium]|jgi:hypothetical protein
MNIKAGRIVVPLLLVALLGILSYVSYSKTSDFKTTPSSTLTETKEGLSTRELYESSRFKIVSIVRNKFISQLSTSSKKYDALYVVVERETDGFRNSTCGPYGAPTCYFFLESVWADTPAIEYIGSYTGGPGINPDSLRFIDEYTVFFTTYSGDGGGSTYGEWELDVRTGSTTQTGSVYSET